MSKNYYILLDNKQEGPFEDNQIKSKKLDPDTLIWFEGAANWTKLSEIKELNTTSMMPPPPPLIVNKNSPKGIKWKLYTIISVAFIVITTTSGYLISNEREKEIIEQQLLDQQIKIQAQEEIEQERAKEEELKRQAELKAKRDEELAILKFEYDNNLTQLRLAKEKLEQIKEFHFLRSAGEKESQVENQVIIIRGIETELDRIEQEIKKY